jgi:hypothetical protein
LLIFLTDVKRFVAGGIKRAPPAGVFVKLAMVLSSKRKEEIGGATEANSR